MGMFAGIWKAAGAAIPEEERENFVRDETELFWRAGILEREYNSFGGAEFWTLQRPGIREEYFNASYDYFVDVWWPDAGIHRHPLGVYSDKVSGLFYAAMVAAYMLECNYTRGPAAPEVDGRPCMQFATASWLQRVFPERCITLPENIWTYLDAAHGIVDAPDKYWSAGEALDRWEFDAAKIADTAKEWAREKFSVPAFLSAGEVLSVLEGTDVWIRDYCSAGKPDMSDAKEFLCSVASNLCRSCVRNVHLYQERSSESEDVQFETLKKTWMDAARTVAANPEARLTQSEEPDVSFARSALTLGAPAFVVALLCETYNRSFWDEWARIPTEIRWAQTGLAAPRQASDVVTTQELFDVSDDEMIPWWTPECDLTFSDELRGRFSMFADRLAGAVQYPAPTKNPVSQYCRPLAEADERYYQVYAFSDFVEESINNAAAPRIRALWTVFDQLVHDPNLTAAGGVIFEDPKQRQRSSYRDDPLKESWFFMPEEDRRNAGRETIKQYLALMGNRALRKDVLGV